MEVNIKKAVKMFFSSSSFEMIYFEAIANALDAGASAIDIKIRRTRDNNKTIQLQNLSLEIHDNGVGIDEPRYDKFSKLFDVEKMKIGTPLSVRTNNNIILDTYISAIKDDGSNFIEITCGNMRINFIDKILKERNK